MKRLIVLGAVGLFSVTAIAACGDDDDDSVSAVQEANAEFCQDLTAYGATLTAFAALDATTATKDDYTSAADAMKSAREALVSSGKDLSDAEWTNLQTQIDTLTGQVKDAPDDEAVATILADAQAQANTVKLSAATVDTAVCTSGSATTTTG